MCFLFILQPCVMLLLFLCSPYRFKGEADPSPNFNRARSCSSTFSLVPSFSQASSSAFSRKSSLSSSDFSLSSSTRRASSSSSIRVCYSSLSIHIVSRARRTPYSNFNPARLCSSAFCIYSSARRASTSVLSDPDPLPQLSALPLQRGVPTLQPLAMCAPPPPPLSVSLQGLGLPPLLPSAVRAYEPLL